MAGENWLETLCEPFANPEVAAVTGLVMPLELETDGQEQFERYCSFIRGFKRVDFTAKIISPVAAGKVGAGACMALRRPLINKLGLFRVELDAGTATQTGGDTYAFYRLLSLGYHIVYNPEAIVWHRHRRSQEELRRVLYGYSVGVYAFLLRCLLEHREVIALYIGGHWFLRHHLKQLWRRLRRKPDAQPLSLTLAEVRGVLAAPWAYIVSRQVERTKSQAFIRDG